MKYKSDAFEAIHEDAVAMYKAGAISRERMKEYDEMCLVQESQTEPEIEESVEMEHVTV
jgi:putative transcriptional regulator